ncbi:MAG: superoxide dismutase [Proteobacteria bacterium]|nr:superoxide dismutase [Pseudomonadota bacterium]
MNVEAPVMPYGFADLEPAMSRDTVVFHFLRHQRVCHDRLVTLTRGTPIAELPLEELIRVTERNPAQHAVYRLAAEVWNHDLFWRSMAPRGGGAARGALAEWIGAHFGGHDQFVRQFRAAAAEHFGSGWLWLVLRGQELRIVATSNAGTPLVRGDHALLGLDLWEHAYYLDHQNRRSAYVTGFLEELVNWDFANKRLQQALGRDARVRAPLPAPAPAERSARI